MPKRDPDDAPKKKPRARKPAAKRPAPEPAAGGDAGPVPVRRRRKRAPRVEALIGFGLDGSDGHTRITKGDHFVLLGGSSETHEQMQEFTIKVTERLARQGKRIPDATLRELRDIVEGLKK